MKPLWILLFIVCHATLAVAETSDSGLEKPPEHAAKAQAEPSADAPPRSKAIRKVRPLYQIDSPALPAPPAQSALAKLLQTQNVRVCVRSDVPPFGFFASQGLLGFDLQLAREIVTQIGIYYKKNLHMSWQTIEAGERIPKLHQKSCDFVAAAFSYTPKRAQQVSFSSIYLETEKVAIASTNITRQVPIIAIVRGTTNYAKGLKGAIRFFSNYKEIIHAMKNGEVDYVVTDRPIATHMMRSVTKSFRLFKVLPQKERYGLGVHKRHPHLLRAINRALRDLAYSGRLAHLYRQWL